MRMAVIGAVSRAKAFQQRKGIAGEVKPGKIYVAISLSDGDNIQFDANSLYQIFKEGKRRGEVPVGSDFGGRLAGIESEAT